MWGLGTIVRVMGLAALAALAGCAQFNPSQPGDKALVNVGFVKRVEVDTAQYAGNFTPYAIMAARAYEKLGPRGEILPDPTRFVTFDGMDVSQTAYQWLARWRYVDGEDGPVCPTHRTDHSCSFISGLQFMVWRRDDCSEVAIVFRGTVQGSLGDWLSNFHGVLRVLPLYDQYEQVQRAIDRIVKYAKDACPGRRARIVTVGHSLGGGLAQQAAWMTRDIRRVYAFDPSFVTGSHDPHSRVEETKTGLTIDRVYEHGEILAYPRFVIRRLIGETPCNPKIRGFRVNLIHGQPVFQHSMAKLAAGFVRISGPAYNPASMRALPDVTPGEAPECFPSRGGATVAAR